VIVCERDTRWASGVRLFVEPKTRIVETRTTNDAWQRLWDAQYGLLVLEVDAQRASAALALMVRVQAELPNIMIIAGTPQASVEWELLLREAGASLVLSTPPKLLGLKRWIHRHLDAAPQVNKPFHERIWDHLPWPEVARSSTPPVGV
jgi:hypothetical protein